MNIFDENARESYPTIVKEIIQITEQMGQARRDYYKARTRMTFWRAFREVG